MSTGTYTKTEAVTQAVTKTTGGAYKTTIFDAASAKTEGGTTIPATAAKETLLINQIIKDQF